MQELDQLQEGYDEMSGFQSCDLLMSQLPWRVFHLKIIYGTNQRECWQITLLSCHRLKNALFLMFFIWNHFHFARKLLAAFHQAQMAAPLPVRFQILLMRTIVPEKWLQICADHAKSRRLYFSDFSFKLDQTSGTTFRYQPIC